jgi:hypothetical protein
VPASQRGQATDSGRHRVSPLAVAHLSATRRAYSIMMMVGLTFFDLTAGIVRNTSIIMLAKLSNIKIGK